MIGRMRKKQGSGSELGACLLSVLVVGCGHVAPPASGGAPPTASIAEGLVLQTWKEFRRHVEERDGTDAVDYVADGELALFGVYRSLALYAPKDRLAVVRPWLSVPALALRAIVQRSELEAMGPREVFAVFVNRTAQSEGWPKDITIEKMQGANVFARLRPDRDAVLIMRDGGPRPTVVVTELLSDDRRALSERLGVDLLHPKPPASGTVLAEAARWVGMPASTKWWNELAPHEAPKAWKEPTKGRLAAEVIQRTVRDSFIPFRFCYEDGLERNSTLEGRIAIRFVIEESGRVGDVTHTSTIADADVNDCIASTFALLAFPRPVGGIVRVTYPIMFSPG